ncbi:MAG: PAS domain S-box protein [Bacteroidales bacterium]|nr:PAS domain S-box protein [Bacteroidales bacterium]MBN2762050.1 PAS domain S-box protein [Bacteroidales bacterium]
MKIQKRKVEELSGRGKNSTNELYEKNKLLSALFDYSVKLSRVSFSENFYIIAASELKKIFSAFAVTISIYNPEKSELILQYSTFSESQRSKAMKLIGHNLEGMCFKLSQDMHDEMLAKWVKTMYSLNELTFGSISPVMGKLLEKAFKMEWFSSISLQDKQTLIGSAVIFGKKGTKPPSDEELKGFSGVTAVTLSRWINEQEVLQTEMKFKSLAENMKDVLWQSDNKANILYFSPSGMKILGYSPEEMKIISFIDIISRETYESISKMIAKQKKLTGKNKPLNSFAFEIEIFRRDGVKFWAEIVSNPVYNHLGYLTGYQGVARDITERKAAELKIKEQYERLEQLNAEKDKLFSIIAHDLKGALHGFLGYSKYMADRIHSLSMDKLEEYSKTIRTIALDMNELLENLLEWSMMQRERINYTPENFNFNDILENSLRIIDQQAQHKEINIVRNTIPDLKVFADYQMITCVIRNLVSNAVKFTNRHGKIEILNAESTDHFVEIMIRDNGIGIEKDTLERLFKIDNVMKTPGTEGESSTGLGLIICHEYISKHRGKIWIESEVNKGTCVHFTLPIGD